MPLSRRLAAGVAAVAWLLLRSGTKPSRISYPCQQAALSVGARTLGARNVVALLLAAAAVVLSLAPPAFLRGDAAPADYRATVFHKSGCAQTPVGDRFPGLDDLVEMMGARGLKLYRSDTASLVAGPDGIVAASDVVVVKINYQWPERGGTNTDLLRGLIRRIVDHPDGFTGEVVVCENAQFVSTQDLDRAANNAEDLALSPRDVVAAFRAAGWRASLYDWTEIQGVQVQDYDAGDPADGYVVGPYDPQILGRVSYPKFTTEDGTKVSMKKGVWTETAFDRGRLKVINVPVLKSHHATYGATACTKNAMGIVTGALGTNSHYGIRYGLLGSVLGAIGPADLNILDAIWINAHPYQGPATPYGVATRTDALVASRDPIAADRWAVANVLIPGFVANGYSPPWPAPSADPDDPSSAFRIYLDASMARMLAAGLSVTNDPSKIDVVETAPPGEASDPDGTGDPFTIAKGPNGFELAWSRPVRGGTAEAYVLYRSELFGAHERAVPECEAWLGAGTTAVLPALPDGFSFLVVGRNGAGDGSFGHDSRGRERPSPAPGDACP